MDLKRIGKHLFAPHWIATRVFSNSVIAAIEAAIRASEASHDGELRFALEAGLHPLPLLRGQTSRQRAHEVFSSLRVWDTEHNSGVLIYVQLIDRCIEIVADRGISAKVPQPQWDAICHRMEVAYRQREFMQGTVTGIEEITVLLAQHFPPGASNPNELPDRPVVL